MLEKASSDGEEARVMSILAPGVSGPIDTSDLGLKKDYSSKRARSEGTAYNDNFVAVSSRSVLPASRPSICISDTDRHFQPGIRHSISEHVLHPHLPRFRQHAPVQQSPLVLAVRLYRRRLPRGSFHPGLRRVHDVRIVELGVQDRWILVEL